MIRTVVYEPRGSKDVAPQGPEVQAPGSQTRKDEFGDKLVKYIPAEVIAFFLPAYALAENERLRAWTWLPLILVVTAALGLVGYLLIRAPKENPPRWYFYVLSVVAFLAWAAGTSAAGTDVFHLLEADITGKLILMGAVFAIPVVDELLARYLP